MPDYIVLGSDHKWSDCYNWCKVLEVAKSMFENGCEYVTVIKNNKVAHWTSSDIKK